MRFIVWLRNLLSVLPRYNQCLPGMLQDLGIIRVLESVRHNCPDSRLYQASSSGIFGKVSEAPQNANTPFYPRNPHGFAKVYDYWACINCRKSYRMHASNGILFNHESPQYSALSTRLSSNIVFFAFFSHQTQNIPQFISHICHSFLNNSIK